MIRRRFLLLAVTVGLLAAPLGAIAAPGDKAPPAAAVMQVNYRTANVDGVDVFYREAGLKDAPVLLLLHGFPTSSHMFRNLIPQLADQYVGFAAESQKLHEFADAKRRKKKVPLMVANLAQDAIGAEDNEITLLDDSGTHTLPRAAKTELARELVAYIAKGYGSRKTKNS